ncbi:ABC transporter substrate-binding protein [Streptomyces sp. 4N509B]|uniref:ABC transporter substrate-binding protein n=1 Tax=Streptomyces sp. 4N509B TaxID=3457413 RepID=UPI003FD5D3F5
MTLTQRRNAASALVGSLLLALVLVEALWSVPAEPQRGTVTVIANWTDGEEEAFVSVLRAFEEEHGIEVDYQGTRAVQEVLRADIQSGSPPDVAILSSLGELRQHQANGELAPLDGHVEEGVLEGYGELWSPPIGERRYWFPVRVEVKSLVWYDTAEHRRADLDRLTGDGDSWCAGLGSGATSGWPGTDWVEDLLLQQAGAGVYEAWARGDGVWDSPTMRAVWDRWVALLSGGGSHRATDALTSTFSDAARRLVDDTQGPRCALNHMGSVSQSYYLDADTPRFVPSAELILPGGVPDREALWEVSGDFAAMFQDSPEARELIDYLASAQAQRTWIENAPAHEVAPPLSAHPAIGPDAYGEDVVSGELSGLLHSGGRLCLDASDVMPANMRDAFHQAVIRYLAAGTAADAAAERNRLLRDLEKTRGEQRGPWLESVCSEPSTRDR